MAMRERLNDGAAWHEQAKFWDYYLPILIARGDAQRVGPEVEQTLQLLNVPDSGRILDLGCGIGRHAIELARRGFHVTGVDRTAKYLELARARAESETLDAEFIVEDMRRFRSPNRFEGAISLFTSFGYFQSQDEDRQALQNVYDSLRDGGSFLVDVEGKEVLSRTFRERDWQPIRAGGHEALLLEEREILPNWSGVRSRWIFIEEERRGEFSVTVRLYSAMEMIALMKECGFREVEVYGSLAGAPYDQNASRLVAVGRK